jgi:hypothetical protein
MSDNTSHRSDSKPEPRRPNLMMQAELTGMDFLREFPLPRLWRWLRRGKSSRRT